MRKTVLITGASRGIGASIARKFAENNYNIIINYNKSKEQAKKLQEELEQLGVEVLLIKADVKDENEVKNMIKESINKFKNVDVLINNAGIAIDTLVDDKKIEDIEEIIKTNLIGPFIICREYANNMETGNIINITSTNGIDTYYPYSLDYDASKAALISLTHNLAVEYSKNIRVNAVAPGWVNTEMNKKLDEEFWGEILANAL